MTQKRKKQNDNSKVALGLILIVLGTILVFGKLPSTSLGKSFADEPVRVEGLRLGEKKNLETPKRILIPSLSIDLTVKEAKVVNGYWEVFADSAAWGEGSGYPGEVGNQVIFAHSRPGLFLPLGNVKKGDYVYILTNTKWFVYKVEELKEVFPNQVQVIAPTEDETLTLYTCSGFRDSKRLIVITKRV